MHAALAGCLAGLLHVVSGPDHLVAVAPLAMKRPFLGLRIGLTWGIGHATGVVLVGLLGVLLRSLINIEKLSQWAEFVVGFVLVGVGIWAILQMRKIVLHKHPHLHDKHSLPPNAPTSTEQPHLYDKHSIPPSASPQRGQPHLHNEHSIPPSASPQRGEPHLYDKHSIPPSASPQRGQPHLHNEHSLPPNAPTSTEQPHLHDKHSLPPNAPTSAEHAHIHVHAQGESHDASAHHRHHLRGSFVVGLIHGAAGTGHLLGVLPSLALPPLAGLVYLGCYGTAAVLAMGLFGLVMGIVGHRLRPTVLRSVMLGCGVLAIGLGLFWLGTAWQDLA